MPDPAQWHVRDLRNKLKKKTKPDATQAEPNSNWAERIESKQSSSMLPVPVIFGSADLINKDSQAKIRSKLAHKLKSCRVKEEKKSYRDKASSDDSKQHMERIR